MDLMMISPNLIVSIFMLIDILSSHELVDCQIPLGRYRISPSFIVIE